VTPKRGRVVIWPSTLNHDPDQQDLRTNHAALPVEAGIKYGANAWIHQRDYKASHNSGCT
jgi:prolyl 4-hydroxylase